MAWTTPKTWAAGETLTAANFNTHIRDNLNAGGPHLIVRKTADESVTSSTTPQDDNDLLMAVAANEIWKFEFNILATGAAGDISLLLTFPAGGTLAASAVWADAAGTLVDNGSTLSGAVSGGVNATLEASPDYRALPVSGVFVNSSTAGTLQLQWAQATSSGTATTVKANSTLWAVQLA